MRIDEITKFFDDIETIDIEKEVAEKLFKTDSNGNPIIGQYINGYEGINFQNLVAKARAAAQAKPREERKAIDDMVDAEIQKHLANKKKKAQQPKNQATKPGVSNKAPEKKKIDFVNPEATKKAFKGVAGWVQKHIGQGAKFADQYTKVTRK